MLFETFWQKQTINVHALCDCMEMIPPLNSKTVAKGKKNKTKHDFINLSDFPAWNDKLNRWLCSLIHVKKKKKKNQSMPSITKVLNPNI